MHFWISARWNEQWMDFIVQFAPNDWMVVYEMKIFFWDWNLRLCIYAIFYRLLLIWNKSLCAVWIKCNVTQKSNGILWCEENALILTYFFVCLQFENAFELYLIFKNKIFKFVSSVDCLRIILWRRHLIKGFVHVSLFIGYHSLWLNLPIRLLHSIYYSLWPKMSKTFF